ncbi:MAG TPA: Ig-like domain-containing protein, partial [Burkholderiales bacterium]
LGLTYGELLLDSVTKDLDALDKFLECKANPRGDHGKTFEFKTFDLDVRNIEAYEIKFINSAPTANDDEDGTDEDTPLVIAPLANDTDPDHLDALTVTDADATSLLGAKVSVAANGTVTYDPTNALKLQQLAEGKTAVDSFSYTIADLGSESATAKVEVTVTGVNDAPKAVADSVTLPVVSGGGDPVEVSTLDFTGAPSTPGFTAGDYQLSGFFGNSDTGEPLAAVAVDQTDPDGTVVRVDGAEFSALSVEVALFGADPADVSVTIAGFKDGAPVVGLSTSMKLSAVLSPVDFGTAWIGIDELRFDAGAGGGYLFIDNLRLGFGEGGGGGVVVEPIDITVLDNDTDVDIGDVISVVPLPAGATSARGAAISVNTDGTIHYDPTGADIPPLDPGETAIDTFQYTIQDGAGATSVATVSITLLGADEPDPAPFSSLAAPDVDVV